MDLELDKEKREQKLAHLKDLSGAAQSRLFVSHDY